MGLFSGRRGLEKVRTHLAPRPRVSLPNRAAARPLFGCLLGPGRPSSLGARKYTPRAAGQWVVLLSLMAQPSPGGTCRKHTDGNNSTGKEKVNRLYY